MIIATEPPTVRHLVRRRHGGHLLGAWVRFKAEEAVLERQWGERLPSTVTHGLIARYLTPFAKDSSADAWLRAMVEAVNIVETFGPIQSLRLAAELERGA